MSTQTEDEHLNTKEVAQRVHELFKADGSELRATDLVRSLELDARVKIVAAVLHESKDLDMDRFLRDTDSETQRALGMAALTRHFGQDFKQVFGDIDKDKTGDISRAEFKYFLRDYVGNADVNESAPPTTKQLFLVFLNAAIPNMIFGMLDNSIMIVGGDVVDDMIGSTFQLSTLACAALANTFADVFGMSVGTTVERWTGRLGVPQANLSPEQAKYPSVRRVNMLAGPVGILIGCIVGMTPLLFRNEQKAEEEKLANRIDLNDDSDLSSEEIVVYLRSHGYPEATREDIKYLCSKQKDGSWSVPDYSRGYKKLKATMHPEKT